MRGAPATPRLALAATSPSAARTTATTARFSQRPVALGGLAAGAGFVCSAVTFSVLTEAGDQVGVLAVRVQPPGHQVARTHPAPASPLPERQPGAGSPGRSGEHLHPFQALLNASGGQRMGIGEGPEKNGGEVPVHHRHAVLRAPPVGGLVLVEEPLADHVALVVLVEP